MPVLDPVIIPQGVTYALRVETPRESWEGWTFAAQIRPEPGSAIELVRWENGGIEPRPYAIFIPLDAAVTATWTWDHAWFGLEATSPEGQVLRLVQRPVILDKEVVR